jgi:hypothetical protein
MSSSPSSVWEPVDPPAPPARAADAPAPRAAHAAPPPAPAVPPLACEPALIAILDAPVAPGETATDGFRRKEHEVGAVFAAMSIIDSWHLHRRLLRNAPGDALAASFQRLTGERRDRLLRFLGDARRREALGNGRGCVAIRVTPKAA